MARFLLSPQRAHNRAPASVKPENVTAISGCRRNVIDLIRKAATAFAQLGITLHRSIMSRHAMSFTTPICSDCGVSRARARSYREEALSTHICRSGNCRALGRAPTGKRRIPPVLAGRRIVARRGALLQGRGAFHPYLQIGELSRARARSYREEALSTHICGSENCRAPGRAPTRPRRSPAYTVTKRLFSNSPRRSDRTCSTGRIRSVV